MKQPKIELVEVSAGTLRPGDIIAVSDAFYPVIGRSFVTMVEVEDVETGHKKPIRFGASDMVLVLPEKYLSIEVGQMREREANALDVPSVVDIPTYPPIGVPLGVLIRNFDNGQFRVLRSIPLAVSNIAAVIGKDGKTVYRIDITKLRPGFDELDIG